MYIHNSLATFIHNFFSVFISTYAKASANDVLIRFIENWKQSLDNHKYVCTDGLLIYKIFLRDIECARFFFQEVLRDNKCAQHFSNKVVQQSAQLAQLFLSATFSAFQVELHCILHTNFVLFLLIFYVIDN